MSAEVYPIFHMELSCFALTQTTQSFQEVTGSLPGICEWEEYQRLKKGKEG